MFADQSPYLRSLVVGLVLLLGRPMMAPAQESEATYGVSLYLGAGYSRFVTDLDIPGLNKNGFTGTVRLMWEPEHLLSVGLETGYIRLYSFQRNDLTTEFGTADVSSSLSSVPIRATFSMRIVESVQLTLGLGGFLLFSRVTTPDNETSATQYSTGGFVAASYMKKIGHRLHLGGEVQYSLINKIQDNTLGIQLVLAYRLLEY
jgi:hypothetical protein